MFTEHLKQNASIYITDEDDLKSNVILQRSISWVWPDQEITRGPSKKMKGLYRQPCERMKKILEVIFRSIRIRPT